MAYVYPPLNQPRRIVASSLGRKLMKQLRSSRRLIKMWHRRDKATVDHVVGATGDAKVAAATTHSAFTASGLAVQDQVRKAWHPYPTGLSIF
jgi:CMP-2-keto-3-deoxyoctulosonic acid synthetase